MIQPVWRRRIRDAVPLLVTAVFVVVSTSSAVFALQGVIEQTVEMPDPVDVRVKTTTIELRADAADSRSPNGINATATFTEGGVTYVSGAFGESCADGQKSADASAKVSVYENLHAYRSGNYSNGDGMRSTRSLQESYDADTLTLRFTPSDNPHGQVEVEVIQKTYVTVWIKFAANRTDDQTKYFYFRVANSLIDGTILDTSFQWSMSAATSQSSGAGLEFKLDGVLQAGARWQSTIDQGVNGFEHLASSRVAAVSKVLTFNALGPGDKVIIDRSITVDAGFEWNLNTVDDNSWEIPPAASTLEGKASYRTVIGLGRITIMKNSDGGNVLCPKQWHRGDDIGNPELTDDRVVKPTVTYVVP